MSHVVLASSLAPLEAMSKVIGSVSVAFEDARLKITGRSCEKQFIYNYVLHTLDEEDTEGPREDAVDVVVGIEPSELRSPLSKMPKNTRVALSPYEFMTVTADVAQETKVCGLQLTDTNRESVWKFRPLKVDLFNINGTLESNLQGTHEVNAQAFRKVIDIMTSMRTQNLRISCESGSPQIDVRATGRGIHEVSDHVRTANGEAWVPVGGAGLDGLYKTSYLNAVARTLSTQKGASLHVKWITQRTPDSRNDILQFVLRMEDNYMLIYIAPALQSQGPVKRSAPMNNMPQPKRYLRLLDEIKDAEQKQKE